MEEKADRRDGGVPERAAIRGHLMGRREFVGMSLAACAALLPLSWSLAGCKSESVSDASDGGADDASRNPVIEQSATEIGTYETIDPQKTQLVIGIAGGDDVTGFLDGFSAAFPDVQAIVCYLQIGNLAYSPAVEWVKHGYAPDIIVNCNMGSQTPTYQVDLTDTAAAAAYDTSALTSRAIDGRVYSLPGPSRLMGIAYNKTLFDKHGWQVPQTFDDFLALCDRIADEGEGAITPFNANAKYVQDYLTGLEGFSYGQVFSGVDNAAWYDGLLSGSTSFSGHMEPFFDMVQQLIDHGVLDAGSFDYSYTTRIKEFLAGKIAMIDDYMDMDLTNDAGYEFGFIAFPSTDGGEGYIPMRSTYSLGETTRDRTEEQARAATEFLDYISTPDAQLEYIGDSLKMSRVTGVGIPNQASTTSGLDISALVKNGQMFNSITFTGGSIPSDLSIMEAIRQATLGMAKGELTTQTAVQQLDQTLSSGIADPDGVTTASETLATVSVDFSVLQTSEYVADMFKEVTGAQIALIPDNSIYRGNIHRMFKGELTAVAVTAMLPRSFDNGSSLVKLSMTGAQLMGALNDPPGYNGTTANCVYAFSGLNATVAPLLQVGSKYRSVTLSDGTPLDDNAMYTVACWQGMLKDDYVGDTVETYDGSYTDFLAKKVAEDAVLAPANDGRMTLEWA